MPEIPASLAALLDEARVDEDVVAVLRFGSVVRGQQHARSDQDVCLILRPRADAWDAQLRYAGNEGLDVHAFEALPLHIRARVVAEAEPLLMKDEEVWYRTALDTWRRWQDYRPFVEEYLESAGVA